MIVYVRQGIKTICLEFFTGFACYNSPICSNCFTLIVPANTYIPHNLYEERSYFKNTHKSWQLHCLIKFLQLIKLFSGTGND